MWLTPQAKPGNTAAQVRGAGHPAKWHPAHTLAGCDQGQETAPTPGKTGTSVAGQWQERAPLVVQKGPHTSHTRGVADAGRGTAPLCGPNHTCCAWNLTWVQGLAAIHLHYPPASDVIQERQPPARWPSDGGPRAAPAYLQGHRPHARNSASQAPDSAPH